MFSEADTLSFQTEEWTAIPRIARTVPFGYEVDENNPDLLQPVPLELEALKLAKQHLKQFSYREVAQWLSATTGRYISHVGLKKRLDNENNRRRKISTIERWTRTIEQKKAKVEAILNSRTGASRDRENS